MKPVVQSSKLTLTCAVQTCEQESVFGINAYCDVTETCVVKIRSGAATRTSRATAERPVYHHSEHSTLY